MANISSGRRRQEPPGMQPQAHFYVYENLAYVRDRIFEKDRISIGSSPRADLVLDHQSVAEFHALVHFEGHNAFLTNHFPDDGLRLNGRSVTLEMLKHEDVIDIGPFSVKIKMGVKTQATASPSLTATAYCVRLVKGYDSPEAVLLAAQRLAELMRRDISSVLPLFQRDHVVIKRNLSEAEALRWQKTLTHAGILCDHKNEEPSAQIPLDHIAMPQADYGPGDAPAAQAPAGKVSDSSSHDAGGLPNPMIREQAQDDDEDEIWLAPFVLCEKLTRSSADFMGDSGASLNVQIIKTVGDCVVDAGLLNRGRKYRIDTENGRFCLARHHAKEPLVYITPAFKGYVANPHGEVVTDLDSYKSESYRFGKKTDIYGIPITQDNIVVINDAGCRYFVSLVPSLPSPEATVAQEPSSFSWRHWAWSAGTHLFLILCLSIYLWFQAPPPKGPELHFVKIDPSMLQKPEAPKAPEPVKKEPPPVKAEPQRPVEKKAAPKKKAPRPPATAKSSKKPSKIARAGNTNKHPNAGGGFGQGNIKNRDINQAGILSVLGSTKLSGPSEAIAAVTNLDAVPVPGSSEKNFTVGGLKGSLGSGKISVATGEIVQTKGSQQVLRSAGAGGTGEVAALEKGAIGKKHVQAMVTAKLNRTVKIEGGMSREMVKRVIDQHLEEITYCYETALMTNPSILGRIVFEWKILMDGRVGEIRIVASSVNSHEIHDCIQSAIKSWQFPKPKGTEVVVSYPFVFDLVAF